jgi:hypothetical protein
MTRFYYFEFETMQSGGLKIVIEVITRNSPGDKGWPAGTMGRHHHLQLLASCLQNVEVSMSDKFMGIYGLFQG